MSADPHLASGPHSETLRLGRAPWRVDMLGTSTPGQQDALYPPTPAVWAVSVLWVGEGVRPEPEWGCVLLCVCVRACVSGGAG